MLRKIKNDKSALALIACLIILNFSVIMSSAFQNDFGTINVQIVYFTGTNGERLVGKLYRPADVSASNPAPGILSLHGFNNDKDVERPGALELARAGFIVFSLDQAGHGDSGGSLITDMILPTNSYLEGYAYLKSLPFVNPDKMGIFGHSMGSSRAREIALAYPDHDAIAVQSFAPSADDANPNYHNLLHLWAIREEFGRSALENRQAWLERGYQQIASNYGVAVGEADKTYGSFSDGTARRHALIMSTHPGLTCSIKATSEIVAWMLQALKGLSEAEAWIIANPSKQIWIGAEIFGLIALLTTVLSIIPLFKLLLRSSFFESVAQPLPQKVITTEKKKWWTYATINVAIGGITYLIFTPYLPFGFTSMFPNPFILPPIYTIGIASAFMLWFIINAIISLVFFRWWYKSIKKTDPNLSLIDMGFGFEGTEGQKIPINWNILGKTILIALILFGWMYLWTLPAYYLFNVELRGIWSLLKPFTTVSRFIKFWFYIWPLLAFSLMNGGVFLFGQLRQKEESSELKTYLIWWLKTCYAMLMGLVAVILIQYMPMWFGGSPILNGIIWISPMMEIQLMSFIPIAGLLFLLSIYFYRKTGRVFLGAFIFTFIAIWIEMTGLVIYL
ncbi:MAG: alpha/beta hydrolase [Promethearchaeota archaeon]